MARPDSTQLTGAGFVRETGKALLLVATGWCLGARFDGASVWWGLLGVLLLLVWVVSMHTEPGPNDPS